MKNFTIIVAATAGSHGIGKGGSLPWNLPADMAFFKQITSHAMENSVNAVIMGRKTWEVKSQNSLNTIIMFEYYVISVNSFQISPSCW